MWPLPSSVPGCTAGFCPESPTYVTDSHGRGGSSNSASPEDTNGNYSLNIQPTIVNGRITSIAIPGLANPYTFTYGTTTRNYTPSSALVSSVSVGNCVSVLGKDQETVPVVQAITLPNGQQYQFLYDSTYGVLKTITYPTGATVQYTWAEQPASESLGIPAGTIYCAYVHGWPYVQKRVVSFDGVTPALEQDFQYQTLPTLSSTTGQWTQKITTVTTKDLLRPGTPSFQTIYTYSPMSLTDPSFGMFIGQSAVENRIVYQDWNGSVLQTVTKNWALESPDSVLLSQCVTLPNNLTAGTFYSYGNLDVVTDKKEYDYGILSSSACAQGTQPPTPTATRETVMTPQSFQTTPLYPTGPSIFDRFSTVKIYANGASGTLMSETDLAYDVQSIECAGYPSCVTPANHDETGYGINSTAPRGNLTSAVEKCFNGPCSSGNSTSTYVYDQTGQVLSATDACGNGTCADMPSAASHTTTYSYADNYSSCGGAPPSSSPTNAYVTLIKDPLGHTTTYCYGYDDGQLRGATDPNLQTTTYIYNTKPSGCGFQDMLGRVGEIDYPDLGKEYICYNDSPFNNSTPSPSVTTTRTINSSTNLATLSAMDGMGRVVQTRLTSDPDGVTYTDTAYDGLGRPYQVYNPTRCNPPTTNCGEPTWGVTTTFYDGLGRTCLVVPPDGALPSSSLCPTAGSQPLNTVLTTYSGNTTMVTDQTGKARETVTDGLGRLTQVFEDPGSSPHLNYETDYRYDALNNLLCVAQNNAGAFSGCSSLPASWRPRTFTYDSLSRLTSATNPESGTITYSYDPNGNLSTKISPAPNQTGTATVTASYTHDPLNRLTQKSFSDGTTPTLKYGYDAIALTGCTVAPPALTDSYPVGRRTAMCDGGGSESWSHDKLGRLLTASRTTNSVSKSFLYTYNFDGSQYQMTYPNQSSVTYTQGGAGRPLQLVGNGVTITANAHYLPNGDLCYRQDDWDGSWTTTKTFNNRFQPVTIQSVQMFSGTPPPVCGISPIYSGGCCSSKLDLKYSFTDATGHNNGNVVEIYNNLNMERTQLFSYDSLNRLATAETLSDNQPWYQGDDNLANCWGEQYTYDAWGNFSAITPVSSLYTGCNQESLSMLPTSKNQLQDTNNDYVYDSAGNLTQPGPIGGPYVYDAENHLTSAGGVTYTYDGDGNRIMKSNGTIYWYGASSASLMETDLSGNVQRWYYFFNGQRVGRQLTTNEVGFYMTDHLGNVRYLSGCCTGYNIEYYPFGGVILNSDTGDDRYQFTGKERDSESGLDNFGARFDSSSFGRFISPDWSAAPTGVPYANFGDPQSLNLYAYVRSNPINATDPDGHECTVDGEKHGRVWCAAHSLGLTETKKEAEKRRAAEEEYNRQWRAAMADPQYQYIVAASLTFLGYAPGAALTEAEAADLAGAGEVGASVEGGTGAVEPVRITAADGTEVTGFTTHGVNRAVGEGAPGAPGVRAGTTPQAILDALKNPKSIQPGVDSQGRPFKIFTGQNARVIVNPTSGKIVSVNPTSATGAH